MNSRPRICASRPIRSERISETEYRPGRGCLDGQANFGRVTIEKDRRRRAYTAALERARQWRLRGSKPSEERAQSPASKTRRAGKKVVTYSNFPTFPWNALGSKGLVDKLPLHSPEASEKRREQWAFNLRFFWSRDRP